MENSNFTKLQKQINEYSYIIVDGEYEIDSYNIDKQFEIELDDYTIFTELKASAYTETTPQCYDYPEESTILENTFHIEELNLLVYDNEDSEVELTTEQENWLYATIGKNITI